MKQLIITRLYYYLSISIFFISNATFLHAQLQNQPIHKDEIVTDLFTTLHVIEKIHRDIEDQHHQLAQEHIVDQNDCLVDIMVVLVGTYERIVGATVTYYVMINMPIQQNLHQTVAIILAEDIVKIISILGKQLLRFIFNHHMTIQQKIWYCAWIISIIGIIKMGIDTIPPVIKPQQIPIFTFSNNGESSYLNEKFNNYR